jgi:hypothetical protein
VPGEVPEDAKGEPAPVERERVGAWGAMVELVASVGAYAPRGRRHVGAMQLSLVLLLVGAAMVSSAPTPPGGDPPRESKNWKAPASAPPPVRTPMASPTTGGAPMASSNTHVPTSQDSAGTSAQGPPRN